jgi:hypothetical protein
MTKLDFGQPAGAIFQLAYTVPDLDAAIRHHVDLLGIGPWYLVEHFAASEMTYRGEPTSVDYNLALAFTGSAQIELIQQLDDSPSVYRDRIDHAGHGFHHWGIGTLTFDDEVCRLEAQGYEVAFSGRAPVGDRFVYFDTTAHLPGMVELIEMNPPTERMFTEWHLASIGWDGTDPIRRVT